MGWREWSSTKKGFIIGLGIALLLYILFIIELGGANYYYGRLQPLLLLVIPLGILGFIFGAIIKLETKTPFFKGGLIGLTYGIFSWAYGFYFLIGFGAGEYPFTEIVNSSLYYSFFLNFLSINWGDTGRGIIIAILLSVIVYILIGALIGWVIGKIKSKKSDVNPPVGEMQ